MVVALAYVLRTFRAPAFQAMMTMGLERTGHPPETAPQRRSNAEFVVRELTEALRLIFSTTVFVH